MNCQKLLQLRWIACLIVVTVLAAGCNRGRVEPTEPGVGMPDPAASYCVKLGYEYENGDCVFHDGTRCNAWAFYRGKCGQEKTHCERQGFRIENRVEEVGSATYDYAVCVFADNSECLEEAYLAGECKPSECEKWLFSEGGCVAKE